MALATVVTTFNLADYFGADFDARRTKAWATTNAPDATIHNKSTGETRIGGAYAAIASDGTGSFTHWAPGADANPATWQTTYHFDAPDRTQPSGRKTVDLGPFTVTTSGQMTALVTEQVATPTATASTYATAAGASATSAAGSATTAASSATSAAAASTAAQSARTGAETARAGAEAAEDAAQALVLSDLGTTDGQTRALVENPASQTAGALDARADLISDIKWPLIAAHRFDGNEQAEQSLAAARRAFNAGATALECDVDVLSDGTLVPIHDTTVDRTMTTAAGNAVTGSPSAFTLAQWRTFLHKPVVSSSYTLNGLSTPRSSTWENILDEFGGRVLLLPQPSPAAVAGVCASVDRRGLRRSVIIQNGYWPTVEARAAEGYVMLWLNPDGDPATQVPGLTRAQVKAAGVDYVACASTATTGNIAAWRAAGVKVLTYIINSPAALATELARPVDGVFSDNSVHLIGGAVRADNDPFATKEPLRGMLSGGMVYPASGIELSWAGRNEFGFTSVAASGLRAVQQVWAGRRDATTRPLVIEATMHFPGPGTDVTAFGAIFVGNWADQYLIDTKPGFGYGDQYRFIQRRNGDVQISKQIAGGGAPSLISTPGTVVAAASTEGTCRVRVTITATDVTMKNLTTGTTSTVADTAVRTNLAVALGTNNAAVYFSDVSVVGG